MKLALTLLLLLVVIAVLTLVVQKSRSTTGDDAPWPFYAKKPLSHPEQVLYHRLVTALPDYIVLAQVQLSRALGVKRGVNFHAWNNRINRMSFDFLVCAKDSTILAAVELDDRTHESPSRVLSDAKKDRAATAAGIPLIRWKVKAIPDDPAIREAIPKAPLKPDKTPEAVTAEAQES